MKNLLIVLFFLLAGFCCNAQIAITDFVTTWKTNMPRGSNTTSIVIPTTGGGYNYDVDWNNDGVFDQLGITGDVTHDFGVANNYTIRIRGAFPRIFFNHGGDCIKLLDVKQWGNMAWTSMAYAFAGCEQLNITATDLPNLSGVASMAGMFQNCFKLNGPANIGNWNTASVTDMSGMFWGSSIFNQPIGTWNTANVTTMANMLSNLAGFNQPIGNWNTSNVTDMRNMFFACYAFNQPIGNWNTAKVTNMGRMFTFASQFNQPIGNWNTANVTDMRLMFSFCDAFNQPIGNWNTAKVTDMEGMFGGAIVFNQPLANWNTANVTSMISMFGGASSFNQYLDDWALNSVTDMTGMLGASGMDCDHYSRTLIGWAANAATPTGIDLGAYLRTYGPAAVPARNALLAKGWTITDDALSPGCSVLPVTLISFTAKPISGNTVEIKWETAQETQNERFVVERSKDLAAFETVAEIRDVAGNSNAMNSYRAVDALPYPGTSYYRLVQYDLDGTRTASRIVSVIVRAQDYTLYPNPARNQSFRVSVDEPVKAQIQVHNAAGKAIGFSRRPEGVQTVVVTPSQVLPSGTYLVTVQERAAKRTYRLIIQ